MGLLHSAAASGVQTLDYTQFIPSFVSQENLLFYYDAGIFESYPGGGSTMRDLVSGTKTATISGGTYSAASGGEIILQSGSYINLGSYDEYNLNEGPTTIVIAYEVTDTSKRNYVLNKRGTTGAGYIFNAVPDNLNISGSLREISKGLGATYGTLDPGELGFGMISYWSGSGHYSGPLNYPLGGMVEAGQIVWFGGDAAAGAATSEVGTVVNSEPLYVGRNADNTDYANIKVQAIFGYSDWHENISGLETGVPALAFRNYYTSSRQ